MDFEVMHNDDDEYIAVRNWQDLEKNSRFVETFGTA